jgi:phage I-like protein
VLAPDYIYSKTNGIDPCACTVHAMAAGVVTRACLSAVTENALPDRFPVFRWGTNETRKGTFIFDEAAAKSVMDNFALNGVDLKIDLDHQTFEPLSADPTARDARGWCSIELTSEGLDAVRVRWTDDGARRLSTKAQRYTSPAFIIEQGTGRVQKLLNIALVSEPATHQIPALIAASAASESTKGIVKMNMLDLVQSAQDAAKSGDMTVLEAALAAVMDEAKRMADLEKQEEASASVEEAAVQAMSARVLKLTGAPSSASAVEVVESWRSSHVALAAERAVLAKQVAVLEADERMTTAKSAIKCGALAPGLVWEPGTPGKLSTVLASMPLADFRKFFASAVSSTPSAAQPTSPVSQSLSDNEIKVGNEVYTLTDREVTMLNASKTKIDRNQYAAMRLRMNGKF